MGAFRKAATRVARKAVGTLTRKVAIVNADGNTEIKSTPSSGVKKLGWIVIALLLWHFLIQPLLAHFFPDAEFPILDGGWISTIIMGL